MKYTTGICPECSKEIPIPDGVTWLICMYCGRKILGERALAGAAAKERQPVPGEQTHDAAVKEQSKSVADGASFRQGGELSHEEAVQRAAAQAQRVKKAKEQFAQLLFSIQDPLKHFKKNAYEESFRGYQKEHEETFLLFEDAYLAAEDRAGLLRELAEAFVTQVEEAQAQKSRRKQEEAMTSFNMSLVIYVNPALLDSCPSSGKPLAQELLAVWKEHFPKTNLKLSDFASIQGGFKRRFCYITTAVCESLGKPDDCYELNLLREYRDQYLLTQPGGEALVQEYYDIAPTIVKRIEREAEHSRIYQEIWQQYLLPCIRLIEEERQEECQSVYQDMVNALGQRYFYRNREQGEAAALQA